VKTYQATYIPNKTDGVFGISLVENPAMEGLFIALSKKQEIKLAEVNKEQRILMGLVLEPNKPIYRNQNGEEFNIVFNEDTIKELSYNFFKAGYQKNSTIEHESKINGVTFVESWIVEDTKNDKSNAFGFSYPKGSWVATMKVDSDEIWNDYVKSGKVKGFSVDAMINLEEINLKSNITMAEEKTLIDLIKELPEKIALSFKPKEVEEVEVKLGMIKTDDGLEIHFDGEELKEGDMVYSLTPEDEKVPLPQGEYVTELGVISVDENATVVSIKSATEEEAPVEEAPVVEPMAEDTPTEAPKGDLGDELEKAIKSIMIKYSEEFNSKLKTIKTELSKENETLKAQVLELSKAPVKKAISTPTQATTKKGRLTQFLNNKI